VVAVPFAVNIIELLAMLKELTVIFGTLLMVIPLNPEGIMMSSLVSGIALPDQLPVVVHLVFAPPPVQVLVAPKADAGIIFTNKNNNNT
jgi:hypothetical protein